jgi:hypothetical protein
MRNRNNSEVASRNNNEITNRDHNQTVNRNNTQRRNNINNSGTRKPLRKAETGEIINLTGGGIDDPDEVEIRNPSQKSVLPSGL